MTFNLNPQVHIPQVLLRGIVASVPSVDQAPTAWNSTSQVLSSMNDSQIAIIDTSTPYLWLPEAVCDRFADALGLVWNDTFGLYFFKSDQQYQSFLNRSSLSFTFALSSFDNTDNFGQPFDTEGVVNITISSAAFALTVQYPFNPTMHFRDKAIPYFPLMRAPANHSIVIGRAFMQEAYLVTKYEDNIFSLHQALFPKDAAKSTSIVDIPHSPNSLFPVYNGPSSGGALGSTPVGVIAGVVVAGSLAISLIALAVWYCRRRKRIQAPERGDDDLKNDGGSSVGSEPPSSPIERIFSFIIRRKKSRKAGGHEVSGDSRQPVEVGADAHHQLYELPVPLEPVELDSTNEGSLGDSTTEHGTESSETLSPYELARRKLQRQLQGPAPTYSPSATAEKTEQDISPVAHYRPADDTSPISSTLTHGSNSNSFPTMLPSPMTPHADWSMRFDLIAPPLSNSLQIPTRSISDPSSPVSPQSPANYNPSASSMSRSNSSSDSATHSPLSLVPPSAVYQRTPIDPSRVVCLGPLPENVQLPRPAGVPRIVGPDGRTVPAMAGADTAVTTGLSTNERRRRNSTDTLGSNFTVDEERRALDAEMPRQASLRHHDDVPFTPNSAERIDAGSEIIHVPQLAERRYSWEESSSL